jgi:hypothetical protein
MRTAPPLLDRGAHLLRRPVVGLGILEQRVESAACGRQRWFAPSPRIDSGKPRISRASGSRMQAIGVQNIHLVDKIIQIVPSAC